MPALKLDSNQSMTRTALSVAATVMLIISLGCGDDSVDEVAEDNGDGIEGQATEPPPLPPGPSESAESGGSESTAASRSASPEDQAALLQNLRAVVIALHTYHEIHNEFPQAVMTDPESGEQHSWRVAILPFLGRGYPDLYDAYRRDEPWDSAQNRTILSQMPGEYRDPVRSASLTSAAYFAVVGPKTCWEAGTRGIKFRDIRDGTSNTLMVVHAERDIPWTKPEDIAYDPEQPPPVFGRADEELFAACMGDGAAFMLRRDVEPTWIHNLIQRDDGQATPLDQMYVQ